ncbi:MAG: hypothetical protein JXR76_29450 [Deltaproteobacteria bacterium]|nr:hypothetical protein [Deltaproteobacteria bacterium]
MEPVILADSVLVPEIRVDSVELKDAVFDEGSRASEKTALLGELSVIWSFAEYAPLTESLVLLLSTRDMPLLAEYPKYRIT